MERELISILEHLEREKGIKKEVLVQAVEAALASAVRKEVGAKTREGIEVKLDPNTGAIKAFLEGKEIKNIDFGRIAAQTAKQVIIQKIREAEKDVIYDEFSNRVGQIVSGTVYRFDRGNVIVDLLGKAEGFLPKREQSSHEQLRQGERIRAYCLEVRKEMKDSQIILSRACSNFVKKLFELEVPEIFEGIVEVKTIARLAGERTKIAVYSKDEKIDCVGACVGVRGNRVRNIVTELRGEKIDIVRWSEDIQQFIAAALSPAKIYKMVLDREKKNATVIVEDDQLSLAIGKHGQNVRLASKICGWELDIRTKETAKEKAEDKKETKAKGKKETKAKGKKETKANESDLNNLSGVGEKLIQSLNEAGFKDLKSIADSSTEELSKIKGIGEKKAENLIKKAKKSIGK